MKSSKFAVGTLKAPKDWFMDRFVANLLMLNGANALKSIYYNSENDTLSMKFVNDPEKKILTSLEEILKRDISEDNESTSIAVAYIDRITRNWFNQRCGVDFNNHRGRGVIVFDMAIYGNVAHNYFKGAENFATFGRAFGSPVKNVKDKENLYKNFAFWCNGDVAYKEFQSLRIIDILLKTHREFRKVWGQTYRIEEPKKEQEGPNDGTVS